ncbi:hypothetical protein Tco_1017126 [Tanacetum coccineum]|uniref:Uncharacterized protein n=1 Tax=Tanacetum coccineum TaxID=301880 RepID=A0ABQ5FQL7_9ASTR
MANLKYSDKHNMVVFLKKPNESVGFTEVVDFLKGTSLRSYEAPLLEETGVAETTKQTLGNDMVKLVKKVKSLEIALKRKSKKVIVSESESEEPEDQGRIIQNIDDDPLVSLVRESMKKKSTNFGVSKEKSTDKGKRYRRRARSMAKKIDTGLDAEEEINTGREEINTGIEEVSTGSTKVDSELPYKVKVVQRGRIRLQWLKRITRLLIKLKTRETSRKLDWNRLLNSSQFYTEEDWDTIRAKLEANAELSKDVLGQDLPEQDFAKRMVDMVNQRKKHFAEERAKAKRNKPMTQSQLRIYMSNYLKNQGTWKLSQLKKLKFEEIKEEFDNAQEDSETDKEESVEAMNPTPLTTKSDSVVNWKIFQQGQRSVYQIIRANGADTVYMSFGAMIKDFTREDLIELYRLVMQKYGTNRPEDAYDRVLWSDLRTMFDPPLIEDAIWSLPLQQKMVS